MLARTSKVLLFRKVAALLRSVALQLDYQSRGSCKPNILDQIYSFIGKLQSSAAGRTSLVLSLLCLLFLAPYLAVAGL